jgi:SpoVK/Ycf46/Vps4 family AAA+-type ATPase
MGLTSIQQELVKAVAENDIRKAKKCALAALAEDTTQKNQWFVKRYQNVLTSGASVIELPYDLQEILICEDVSLSFRENRYYLTDGQKKIAEQIFRMNGISQKLMEMQIPYKNATLLYGPPGTGKTTFGRYIAFKMGLPFCYLNFSSAVDGLMGATAKNISKAFKCAAANPCVFMLDEVDVISCNRAGIGEGGSDKEIGRVTVTLMQEFDQLPNDVVILAATNRLDILDKAFISRIPQHYEIKPFTTAENKAMVDKFVTDVGIDLDKYEKMQAVLGKGVDSSTSQRDVINRLIRIIAEKIELSLTDRGKDYNSKME